MNKIKQKLAAGEVVTMFNPDFASPRLVEYLGGFGLDAVWIDAERMSYDFERIEEMTRAARASTPICWSAAPHHCRSEVRSGCPIDP